jgi:hypothetical protein
MWNNKTLPTSVSSPDLNINIGFRMWPSTCDQKKHLIHCKGKRVIKLDTQTEICVILGYYAAHIGNSLQTFRDNLSVPSSRVKKS